MRETRNSDILGGNLEIKEILEKLGCRLEDNIKRKVTVCEDVEWYNLVEDIDQ
jgi:hypothetical protein